MNRHSTVIVAALLLVVPAVAAQDTGDAADPGLVTADSPLYRAELALDDALVQANVKTPGDVVVERTAEARDAAVKNATDAQDRAMTALQETAAQADGVQDEDALQQAEQILQGLQEQVPDKAQQGLQTAIDSVLEAKNRFPTDNMPDTDNVGR